MTDAPPIEDWERQPGETATAYAIFSVYRDLGIGRSLLKTYRLQAGHEGATEIPGVYARWSVKYSWVDRCKAYDAYIDREGRRKSEREHIAKIEDYRQRQEDLSEAALTAAVQLLLKSSTKLAQVAAQDINVKNLPAFFRAAAFCAQAASDAGANALGILELISSVASGADED